MSLRAFAYSAVAGLVLLTSRAAFAQDQVWLQDRRYTEGIGYRAGDLEVHPGVAGEFGYDSNYFLRAESERPVRALRFRLTPSLSVSTLSPQRREVTVPGEPPKIAFRAQIAATYNELVATESRFEDLVSEQRHVSGLATARLRILPERPWGGDVYGSIVRMVQPSQNPDRNYDRWETRIGGGIVWQPGGGLFDWRFGYDLGLTAFQQQAFEVYDNAEHQINTRGRWRFLPRTALLYDASLGFIRYEQSSLQKSSDPVRARLGINGLLSRSFAVLAMAGWGASFFEGPNAQQYDGPIGQAELRWFLTPNPTDDPAGLASSSTLALGYSRDFFNSYLGDHYTRDRGYLTLTYFIGQRAILVAEGAAAALQYPTLFFEDGSLRSAPFTNVRLDATGFGEYRFSDSFAVNLTARYSAELSKTMLVVQPPPPVITDDLSFRRLETYLGVRWFM